MDARAPTKGLGSAPPLELWGGVECSIVRIGDDYRNQVVDTGHSCRLDDIDTIAELGVKAVRYPILWESVAPESPGELDFTWHDERLKRLRDKGVKVIAGLVHHGSGPRYTSLLDPNFPDQLADYASRVARRYPWIDMWTPVNEPFTTARFSCLYGHWYPHRKDIDSTFRATVNQCLATLRAMRAIRIVSPESKLIATEDIGRTFSTPELAYQAEHDNGRRWLTFDLLFGRVVEGHQFRRWLRNKAASEEVLEELATGEGRPDIIGFDHYLTSDRFLDHRVERYPGVEHGSNGQHSYVDVEAVRIDKLRPRLGPGLRLRETWERYRTPIAITEVHHGCTREEQVRWLHEMWSAAERERARGVDIRAITLWALFGMMDWRSLLTRREGDYDVGAFDTRSETPRPTLLAKAAAQLGRGEQFEHPVLDLPGWWKRPGRTHARRRFETLPRQAVKARPILITGATGTLGQAFSRLCAHRGLAHVLTSRGELDISDEASIAAALERYRPWAVVNTAGFVRTWEAEQKADECFRANVTGPELLASACKLHGIPLVTFSSDLVFDGKLGRSYVEPDATAPVCEYGRSKAEAEARLMAIDADALIVRTSAFFGPWDRHNFLVNTVERLVRGEDVFASAKTIVSPTYVPDLVHATLDLLLDDEKGIWHLTNQGSVSWHELAQAVADRARLDVGRIIVPQVDEPSDTSLTSKRGLLLRPLDRALDDFAIHSESLSALNR
ncbi:sugar nucleotide-binding protein [Sphingomonas sp. SM33]|uniref:dTDP-4-dehydrorhamnose reductase n=1 Tax=Sphingomonas telluris TaxID=2907998 RepID=A0ABS9VRK8_9SPHN|nr:family 1 glycosylhydrolase [Sphingomonas telluris]MCH8617289.1 sugar nucleotide-binding protein [Sphingomonas telluris]